MLSGAQYLIWAFAHFYSMLDSCIIWGCFCIVGCVKGNHRGHDSCWVSKTKVSLHQYKEISPPLCGFPSER